MTEHSRVLRFLVVGTLAAAVNWLARIALSAAFEPQLTFEMAVVLSYAIGMVCGFALYRAYVFPEAGLPLAVQARRFIAVNLVSAAEVWVLAVVFVRVLFPALGFNLFAESVAHALAIAAGAVTSYAGHRLLTFRARIAGASPVASD